MDAIINRINAEDDRNKMIHKNLCTLALLLLEQITTDKITTPVGAIEGLLEMIRI